MDDPLDRLDYYTLLGVAQDAPVDAVREAFHRFARRYHPDRHVGSADDRLRRATEIYSRGAEAYRVILDVDKRRTYDLGLREGRLRHVPDRHSSGPPGARRSSGHGRTTNARARPFAHKGQEALRGGDHRTAKLNLEIALSHDPGNPWLEDMLEKAQEGDTG